jgi:hypothetical protein
MKMSVFNTVIPQFTSVELTLFHTYNICAQTHYTEPRTQICACSAEDVFSLLNYHDYDLTLSHLVEVWKRSATEDAGESEPEPKERTILV